MSENALHPPLSRRYGGFWLRANAIFLDSLVLLPLWVAMMFMESPLLSQILGFAVPGAYYAWFVASPWQATPGKRWLGVYILRLDGRAMSALDALKRYTIYFVPTAPLAAIAFVAPNIQLDDTMLLSLADPAAVQHIMQQAADYGIVAVPLFLLSVALSLVWFLPAAFSSEKKALHDMLCGTRVVYGKPGEEKTIP